jgi:probable rRNA maturation factor
MLPRSVIARIVDSVLVGEERGATLAVTFLTMPRMRSLNAQYMQHDRPTDVISFALPQPDGSLLGDIYICRGVAAQEARKRGIPVRREIARLVIHGTLHVLGWDHPESEERENSAMWERQERYLGTVA